MYRIRDCRENGNRQHQWRLADGLRAIDRVFAIAVVEQFDPEIRRHIGGHGDLVGRGSVGEQATLLVVDKLFGRQPAHALDKAAFNLADIDGGIDRAPDVVQDIHPLHDHLAGEDIDHDFAA